MQTKDDISYGVVPLIEENGEWQVFLIHQFGNTGDVYWTFPKGHMEEGETEVEAALRELKEETDISLASIDTSRQYVQEYSFPFEDCVINKKVIYYVGIAASKEYMIQEDEVQSAGWYSFSDATERLTHDRAKVMLKQIEAELRMLP